MVHQSACVHAAAVLSGSYATLQRTQTGNFRKFEGAEKEDRDRGMSCASAERIELLPESSISKSRLKVELRLMLIEPSVFDGGSRVRIW